MYKKQNTYYDYQTMQRKTKEKKEKGTLKRYVLRLDLNSFKDDVRRSDMGRLFQSFGPTCENGCRAANIYTPRKKNGIAELERWTSINLLIHDSDSIHTTSNEEWHTNSSFLQLDHTHPNCWNIVMERSSLLFFFGGGGESQSLIIRLLFSSF